MSLFVRTTALSLLIGCSSSTTPPADAGVTLDANTPPDASSYVDSSTRPTVRLTGTIAAGEGFEVCVFEHAEVPCALSRNAGEVELAGVPAASELLVSVAKAGYVPQLRYVMTGTTDIVMGTPRGPFTPASMASETDRVSVTFDAGKTTQVVAAYEAADVGSSTPALGATFTIVPASGAGPFYLDETNHLNPDTKGLTSQAGAWFVNLDAGEGEVVVKTPTGKACVGRAERSWPSPKPNTVKIRNVPGYQMIVSFDCK